MQASVLAMAALLQPASSVSGGGASSTQPLPWVPPPVDSPELLPFLRNTSRPKLAYSTWVGWYMDGGLNETSLNAQVDAMAEKLRPHGWTHILHDYGWQVCGTTYNITEGCIRVDQYGRLYPSFERYPSTKPTDGKLTDGSWKAFTDRAHSKGIAYGLHLMVPSKLSNISHNCHMFEKVSSAASQALILRCRCSISGFYCWSLP